MKLELKHIAPYLPYQLRVKTEKGIDNLCGTMWADDFDYKSTLPVYYHNPNHILANLEHKTCELSEISPILRPMRDLYSEVYLNGRKTTYSNYLYKEWDITDMLFNGYCENPQYGYEVYCFLFEHHFDVFGLIEQGLAVDINTIES